MNFRKETIKDFFLKHSKAVPFLLGTLITILVGILTGILLVYQKGFFPEIERLEDIQPKVMTIIHDDQGTPIKEFAIEKRTIVRRSDIPDILVKALIASEDNQFYSHWGINFKGTLRAVLGVIIGKELGGGSSITQQLALNLFLDRGTTFSKKVSRKLKEILMAIQIEKKYSKDQILTFYCNKIYLGASVYGVEEASRYYFGKSVKDINLAEAVLIPTIMPSPNGRYHVFKNPGNCLEKRNYILKRMLEMKFITGEEYKEAINVPLPKKPYDTEKEEIGNYFVEEVRKNLESEFGDQQLYTGGLRVYTTLNSEMQKWAEVALREGLRQLDKRIGWRTKPGLLNLLTTNNNENKTNLKTDDIQLPTWKHLKIEGEKILEGIVLKVTNQYALVRIDRFRGKLDAEDARWTKRRLPEILRKGDVALFKIQEIPEPLQKYLQDQDQDENTTITMTEQANKDKQAPGVINLNDKKYRLKLDLEQEPEVEGAILVVENKTGKIKAMVGGYSFDKSKWNNAMQALRQTGSTIKPIVYTAALENGYTPSTIVEDEYYAHFDEWTGELWEPRNHEGAKDFKGPLTLRRAFELSRNVCTARIAEHITPKKILDYARKFGITSDLKPYMSISLGAFEVKLSEMVAAYSVFANLGIRVKPFLAEKIVDHNGHVLKENHPDRKQVINKETAFVMNYLLRGVVQSGTGWRARRLPAPIGGKTGTTNEYTNAWFIGFSPSITVGVWVGFHEPRKLGEQETGSRAAAPIFVSFMEKYLEKYTEPQTYRKPPGVVWCWVDKYTGKLLSPDCLHRFKGAFIAGTEPLEECREEDHALITDYYGKEDDEEEEETTTHTTHTETNGRG
ncbi:MAG: PBP1A family penicillin-binding protein [Candidatus Aminicenantes bacterium]|nr:MAG: PBP1A family penicillin-binding protein [Candidatus Aminicenantes bacterium]